MRGVQADGDLHDPGKVNDKSLGRLTQFSKLPPTVTAEAASYCMLMPAPGTELLLLTEAPLAT